MDLVFTIVIWIIGVCFAAAGVLATIRIVRGPSIVDRMVGSDTLLTILISALSADMVIRGHTLTLPLVIGLAMTASVGTMAVARYVSGDRPRGEVGDDSQPGAPEMVTERADRHRDTEASAGVNSTEVKGETDDQR